MAQQTAPSEAETPTQSESSRLAGVLTWMSQNGIFIFTAILILFALIFVDGFGSLMNITDVFHRAAPIGIVAVGMTFVVISGNYLDLSVVAQVATSGVILIAVSNNYGLFPAILAALAAAMLFALVNGTAVGIFKANAVIVTLATTFIGLGLLRLFSGGSIFFGPPDGPVRTFGLGKIGPIPYSAIVLIIMTIVLGLILNRTNFGFLVRSFGVNESATRLGGTNTALVIIGAFLVTAVAAMIAGFVLAAFSNTAVSNDGVGYEFRALAAIIVGGTSVFGGRGSVYRTFLGVIFVSVLTNILVLSGISFGYQQVALGVLIVLAVSLDALARKVAQR
ncbi:MAG: ABC transporter permease [Actinomycetia bacterium]|jgi:ribose transport system permease protein|nr:ABC transporter permease [Actinomycetes bacterium]NKB93435.1 ABC transporter permease [Candidatus Nanopelagicales bacterium]OUV52606.1 MAG: ABC transporter permease [Actinomycetales bacterium TMED115]MCH9707674.1 ABC transporter permease [Actinomycetes bacterium]MCH9789087.1 ABC transporter permease [Actinomycetes bacterium]|tara:strand:- start:2519 stop:3523 length:1005 start_codon:yes stop_codon:yes gene_type:complete